MIKTRFPMMIVLFCLVAAIVISALTFQRTMNAEGSNHLAPVGFGDLRVYESKQALPNTGAADKPAKSRVEVVGIGDLRVYEAQQADSNPETDKNNARVNALCPNASTAQGEHDAGASVPETVLKSLGCQVPESK